MIKMERYNVEDHIIYHSYRNKLYPKFYIIKERDTRKCNHMEGWMLIFYSSKKYDMSKINNLYILEDGEGVKLLTYFTKSHSNYDYFMPGCDLGYVLSVAYKAQVLIKKEQDKINKGK